MWEIRGLAPKISRWSVCSMSGTGWIVLVPKTASEPANLFAQSCVPELKTLRVPSFAMKEPVDG